MFRFSIIFVLVFIRVRGYGFFVFRLLFFSVLVIISGIFLCWILGIRFRVGVVGFLCGSVSIIFGVFVRLAIRLICCTSMNAHTSTSIVSPPPPNTYSYP